MVLKLEQNPALKEIEISVAYPEKNKTVERIALFLKTVDEQIECHSGGSVKMVNISDIYYIESIDKLAVVFCEKEKIQTRFRLYQLNEKLSDRGFVQISKYCIINIIKLDRFKPLVNSRIEVLLTNGAKLFINRKYIANLKKRLEND